MKNTIHPDRPDGLGVPIEHRETKRASGKTPYFIIFAIIFSAMIISAALILNGTKQNNAPEINQKEFQQKVANGIQKYLKNQREIAAQEQILGKKITWVKKPNETDFIRGNPDAEISLIEYSDFECPFCKKFHPTAKALLEKYDGKINWVYRHFPLSFHDPLATTEAEASECVGNIGGNDKFWEFADEIFATTRSNGKGMRIAQLTGLAEKIGINKTKFQTCLDSGQFTKKVKQQIADGQRSNVTGTPGNIILNNKTGKAFLKAGAYPIESISQTIDFLLKK